MAVPTTVLWDRDLHTAAKHAILRRYLDAWWPILLQAFPRATYAEGFAGPGEYSKGEDGSPIEALHALMQRAGQLTKPAGLVLVEQDARRVEHLRAVVAERYPDLPSRVEVTIRHGTCVPDLEAALTDARAWGQPIFVNLDPFNAEVSYDLVQRFARNPASEVLVTLMSQWLTRWAEDENQDQGDITFGGRMWREVAAHSPDLKKRFLVDTYRQRLRDAGFGYTHAFELVNKQGGAFFLVHATSNPAGVKKMKDAMWATDPVRGVTFRDPRDPKQIAFEMTESADLRSLAASLRERLGDDEVDVRDLRDWTLTETPYLPRHATDVLILWRDEGRLATRPTKKIQAGTLVALREPPPGSEEHPTLF